MSNEIKYELMCSKDVEYEMKIRNKIYYWLMTGEWT